MKTREIKFRAWDEQIHGMVYDFKNIDKPITALNENGVLVKSTWFTLMQFIGLADTKGVEIYEGDIVKQFGNPKPFTVEFFNSAWRAHRLYILGTEIKSESLEVIGNIYQNPAHSEIGKDGGR